MAAGHVDGLVRSLSERGSRRGVLGLLRALPQLGGLAALVGDDDAAARGRRKRHKKPHHHRKHSGNHTGKKHKKTCQPHSTVRTCGGKCGPVKNNCQKTVDCGSCTCDPPCACVTGGCPGTAPFCVDGLCQPCSTDPGASPGGTCCNAVSGACVTTCPTSASICGAENICVPCQTNAVCGAGALCVEGACHACDVTCTGSAADCGTVLQAALDGGGTVYVCPGTYQGGFVITTAVNVIGAGQGENAASSTILHGNDATRVLYISDGVGPVTLARLRVAHGAGYSQHGVGVYHAGTTLQMRDCTVAGNTTVGYGAGIYSRATLELLRCTVRDNHAQDFNPPRAAGGGIASEGTTTLTDCLIEANSADYAGIGGGFFLGGGLLTLAGRTEVRGNRAAAGGGFYVSDGTLEIGVGCRVTDNTAANADAGGGIFNAGGRVSLDGPDPSPIVVDNCFENCAGDVPKCAAGGLCPP